jgi:hypothetical protein
METTQGKSLYSYFYLKLAKMLCLFFYSLYLIGEQVLARLGGQKPVGGGGGRERDKRMNMLQIMYAHVCKFKNNTC